PSGDSARIGAVRRYGRETLFAPLPVPSRILHNALPWLYAPKPIILPLHYQLRRQLSNSCTPAREHRMADFFSVVEIYSNRLFLDGWRRGPTVGTADTACPQQYAANSLGIAVILQQLRPILTCPL